MTKTVANDKHPLYSTWQSMRHRCRHNRYYANVSVCDRWSERGQGFRNFVSDMGPRPDSFTLDRVDNNGNYTPENCRWADPVTQRLNQRRKKIKAEWRWVSDRGNRYQARVQINGKRRTSLGYYATPKEAHLAACAYHLENYWRI